jgi:hypothetical protein
MNLRELVVALDTENEGFSHADIILNEVWSGSFVKAVRQEHDGTTLDEARRLINIVRLDPYQKRRIEKYVVPDQFFHYVFTALDSPNSGSIEDKVRHNVSGPIILFSERQDVARVATLHLDLSPGTGKIMCGQPYKELFMDVNWHRGIELTWDYIKKIKIDQYILEYNIVYELDFAENTSYVKISGDSASAMFLFLVEVLLAKYEGKKRIVPEEWQSRAKLWANARNTQICLSAALSDNGSLREVGHLNEKILEAKSSTAVVIFGFADQNVTELKAQEQNWWREHYRPAYPTRLKESDKFFVADSDSTYEGLMERIAHYHEQITIPGPLTRPRPNRKWEQYKIVLLALIAIGGLSIWNKYQPKVEPPTIPNGINLLVSPAPFSIKQKIQFGDVVEPDIVFTPDDTSLVCLQNGKVTSLNLKNGSATKYSEVSRLPIQTIVVSPNNQYIYGAGVNFLYRWKVGVSLAEKEINQGNLSFRKGAISPDGTQVLFLANDDSIRSLTASLEQDKARFGSVDQHTRNVSALCVSPDGKYLVTAGNDAKGYVLSSVPGELPVALIGHSKPILALAIAPNSLQIATASADNTLRVWNISDRTNPKSEQEFRHPAAVTSVCFSKDGRYLFSGCEDSILRVWSTENGTEIYRIKGYTGEISSICLSHNGTSLAVRDDNNNVCIFQIG